MKKAYGDRLKVRWRFFSLEQVNSGDPKFTLWKAPKGYTSRGLPAFRASEAASRQGREAFERFHFKLLEARHSKKQDITDLGVLMDVAKRSKLDLERFGRDIEDRKALDRLAKEHTEAVKKHGVFGTPTFVFRNGRVAFLKLDRVPASLKESLDVFEAFVKIARDKGYVTEIKRPH